MTKKSEQSSDFFIFWGVNKSLLTTILVDILYLQYLKKVDSFVNPVREQRIKFSNGINLAN